MRVSRSDSLAKAEKSAALSSRGPHRFRITARIVDVIVALGLSIGAVASVVSARDQHTAQIALVCALAGPASVAWRRRFPMSAATASVVALLVLTLIQSVHEDNQLIFEPIAMGMNFYMVGRSTRSAGYLWRQVGVLALGIGSSAIGAWHTGGQSVADVVSGSLIFIGLPYAAGLVIRRRKTMSASLTLATGNLEREEERRAALAVIEERNRIARELHDAIAHEVSVMVIQTSVARRRLLRNRQQSEEALRSVIESGHRALEELRQITGVVRRVDAYSGPAPGLSRLADLIAAMQSTGLRVDLSICGSSVALPPGLDLVAYRIIQEALMNTVKHAGPVESFVTLTFLADVLELEVVDSGGNSAATHLGGSGLGLVGMQERVLLFGGTLNAGMNEKGGFTVNARLPLREVLSA